MRHAGRGSGIPGDENPAVAGRAVGHQHVRGERGPGRGARAAAAPAAGAGAAAAARAAAAAHQAATAAAARAGRAARDLARAAHARRPVGLTARTAGAAAGPVPERAVTRVGSQWPLSVVPASPP